MGAAKKLIAADLFCGGGGFSKGFGLACEDLGIKNVRLIAVNHSQVAVETHRANHPWAEHHCSRVDQLDPRKLVPEGRMKILIASPECTNHANARGGRPVNDQSRATAWDVVKWAQELYIETVLIENVREIMSWGPIGADGRPLKSKKGEIFAAWTEAIRRCGYRLEYRILNSADFGGATTRQRFFLIARRGNQRIAWPVPTHAKGGGKPGDLFRSVLKPWRGASEIINWQNKGQSIFSRKKPLAANTMRRIEVGIRKFCGAFAEPFLVILRGTQKYQIDGSARSVKEPLPTVTARGIHAGLVEPFIITPGGADMGSGRSVKEPLPTVLCHERFAMVEPFVFAIDHANSNGNPRSLKEPLPTIITKDRLAIVEPFILQQQSGGAPRSVKAPLPTVAGKGAQALVQAFILAPLGIGRGNTPRSVDQPMPTILTSRGGGHLVQPYIVQVNHGASGGRGNSGRVQSIDRPLKTITGENGHALVEPFLVKYHGTGKANSTNEPLPTVTGRDRCGLVEPKVEDLPDGYAIDILFRMLEPDELARAMGFEGYEFRGTKKQKVLMIGNAVSVEIAKALVKAILEN